MIEHNYVSMKLVNGDNIIGVLALEEDEYFIVLFPIQMKTKSIESSKKEILVGAPWSPFTDEKVFNIFKQDIIMLSPLNESTITYYKTLIDMSELEEPVEEPITDTIH